MYLCVFMELIDGLPFLKWMFSVKRIKHTTEWTAKNVEKCSSYRESIIFDVNVEVDMGIYPNFSVTFSVSQTKCHCILKINQEPGELGIVNWKSQFRNPCKKIFQMWS